MCVCVCVYTLVGTRERERERVFLALNRFVANETKKGRGYELLKKKRKRKRKGRAENGLSRDRRDRSGLEK